MKFNSMSALPVPVASTAGDKVYKYSYVVGDEEIVEEWQIHEQIQSYADSCTVDSIINRYNATGDVALLDARKGVYADVSELPTDLQDSIAALKLAEKAEAEAEKILSSAKQKEEVKTDEKSDQ